MFDFFRAHTRVALALLVLLIIPSFVFFGIDGYSKFSDGAKGTVAQVNGQTQVILRLPNESFSRYISVGERVMDGKILVKRVENPNASTPTVVLEEVGMEVLRKVGEKVAAPVKEGAR